LPGITLEDQQARGCGGFVWFGWNLSVLPRCRVTSLSRL